MTRVLRFGLLALGISAILIFASIMILGAGATARLGETGFDLLTQTTHPSAGPWPASMDSELRFYAPFWGTYGIMLVYMSRTWPRYEFFVPFVSGLFFIGGIGRLISYFAVGTPHPFFTTLMVIELVLPVVFIDLWRRIRQVKSSAGSG